MDIKCVLLSGILAGMTCVALADGVVDAGELMVGATRLERSATNMAASVSVVEARQIVESGALTVDGALKGVAGLDRQSHALPGAMVKADFRGLTSDFGSKSTVVVSHGRRLNEAFQGGVEFGQLPTWSVERVTAYKGPASYAYGSGGMSGLYNIEMKSGRDAAPFGEYRFAGGNYGTMEGYVAGGGQFGKVDAYVLAGHVETDGYRPYRAMPRLEWRAQDYFANLGWAISERDEARFLTGYYHGRGNDREGDRTARRVYQTINWDHVWDSAAEDVLQIRAYTTAEHSTYDIGPFAPPHSLYPIRLIERDYELRTTGVDISETWQPREWMSFLLGGDYRRDRAVLRDSGGNATYTENIWGAFLEADIEPAERWLLTLGLRVDKNESFSGEWSPRVGLIYRLGETAEAYGSVGKAFRAPGFSDRYINTTSIRWLPNGVVAFPYRGNPDLDPSTLTAYEIGVRQRVADVGHWSAAAFYNDIKDSFDFYNGTVQNAAESHTAGFELEGVVELGYGFEATADFSYMRGRIDRHLDRALKGRKTANLAPYKLGAGVMWRSERQSHGVAFRFEDERFADAANTAKLDSHTTVDWYSRYALREYLTLTFAVGNIFNNDYRVYDHISATGYPAAGRRVMVGVEGRF
ncbi:MAG: TonB-dependent receptor [Lentisphaerae bacterium]|jgi:outer membrane receptor protein involved in Fe transport|nr:TonB-dependent receptor [Lentisphaerota bacterium]